MDHVDRFSLLLLEPGEIYFCDHLVLYKPTSCPANECSWSNSLLEDCIRGRLKICSKSLVFDPLVKNIPIIRFPMKYCVSISKGQSVEVADELNKFYEDNNAVELVVDTSVEMLESNIIRPYKFVKQRKLHSFTLVMTGVTEVQAQISQLHRASTLPPMDQNVMIEAIIRSSLKRHNYSPIPMTDCSEEILLEFQASKISPLAANPGRAVLSNRSLYFEPFNNLEKFPIITIPFGEVQHVIKRRYLLRHLGLEIFCKPKFKVPHLYLLFKETDERDSFFHTLSMQKGIKLQNLDREFVQYKWQTGNISSFEYLTFLNSEADRSVNDLTQYPVFPWVIADYVSDNLDLTNPGSFRDLRKPIGALNEDRLQGLKERSRHMVEPKFLYGSHYSTPGFVVYFLMRQHPQYMLCLQNGRFDNPDRMFNSLADTWSNVTTNPSDFKELIPQFYDIEGSTDFLLNRRSISFGMRQNGKLVWDVELPKWANSPSHLIKTMREALECEYISSNLHHWIDLIFGYKQTGQPATDADNVFYHLCYEGAVDLTTITDLNEKLSIEIQIMEFGQIPRQIFMDPHPARNRDYMKKPYLCNFLTENPVCDFQFEQEFGTCMLYSETSGNIIISGSDGFITVRKLSNLQLVSEIRLSQLTISGCNFLPNPDYLIASSWDNYLYTLNTKTNQMKEIIQAHSDGITCLDCNNDVIVTGSWDCLARVWSLKWPEDAIHETSWRLHMDNLICQMEHDSSVQCVALDPNGTCFASGTSDGCLIVWFLERERVIQRITGHQGSINKIIWNPKGDLILSAGCDNLVNLISVNSGNIIWSKQFDCAIRSMSWDGIIVCLGGSSGEFYCYDIPQETVIASFIVHEGYAVSSLVVLKEYLVTCGEEKRICVWRKSVKDA